LDCVGGSCKPKVGLLSTTPEVYLKLLIATQAHI
jgi:hypothetical protein